MHEKYEINPIEFEKGNPPYELKISPYRVSSF